MRLLGAIQSWVHQWMSQEVPESENEKFSLNDYRQRAEREGQKIQEGVINLGLIKCPLINCYVVLFDSTGEMIRKFPFITLLFLVPHTDDFGGVISPELNFYLYDSRRWTRFGELVLANTEIFAKTYSVLIESCNGLAPSDYFLYKPSIAYDDGAQKGESILSAVDRITADTQKKN